MLSKDHSPSNLARWWANTKEMPLVLRLLCQGGMIVSPIFIVLLLVPFIDWDINGRPMSYIEIWTSGAGLSICAFLVLVMVGTWGLAARNAKSRWVLVLAPLAPCAVLLLPWRSQFATESLAIGTVTQLILGAAVIYICLFHLKIVRKYFERRT